MSRRDPLEGRGICCDRSVISFSRLPCSGHCHHRLSLPRCRGVEFVADVSAIDLKMKPGALRWSEIVGSREKTSLFAYT